MNRSSAFHQKSNLIDIGEVIAMTNLDADRIRDAIESLGFPHPARHYLNNPFWRKEDIEAWLEKPERHFKHVG